MPAGKRRWEPHTGKYVSNFPELIRQRITEDESFFCTNSELAKMFGVSVQSIYMWQKSQPNFKDAVSAAREICNDRLEQAAYMRAAGMAKAETTELTERKDAKGKTVFRTMKKTTNDIPPDPSMIKFILTNRRPDKWREKVAADINGTINVTFEESDSDVL